MWAWLRPSRLSFFLAWLLLVGQRFLPAQAGSKGKPPKICVIVRTTWKDFEHVRCLLGNVLWNSKQAKVYMRVHFWLLDVSPRADATYQAFLEAVATDVATPEDQAPPTGMPRGLVTALNPPREALGVGALDEDAAGLRLSDWATTYVATNKTQGCKYVAYSRGADYYTSRWFNYVQRAAHQSKELIVYDFLRTGGVPGEANAVTTDLRRRDQSELGAAVMKAEALQLAGATFLRGGEDGTDVPAKEHRFLRELAATVDEAHTIQLPRLLYLRQ